MELLIFCLLFIAAFASSFIGSLVGGGSLIITSVLLALDFPPLVMIGSRRMSSIGGNFGAWLRYNQQKKVNYKLALILIPISLVGVFAGYSTLVYFEELNLRFLIGVILFGLLAIHIIRDLRGNRVWNFPNKALQQVLGNLWAFWAAFVNNIAGAGGGMLLAYDILLVYGKSIIVTAATSKFILLIANCFAAGLFWSQGLLNWNIVIVMFIGHTLGGWFGARFHLKKSEPVLRIFLYGVVLLMILRILLLD